ncbi:hypothetical protein [Shewanella donghaensis]|nr:hypothetical protein [Shewanella donghaensis]
MFVNKAKLIGILLLSTEILTITVVRAISQLSHKTCSRQGVD